MAQIEHTTVEGGDGPYTVARRLLGLVNNFTDYSYWNSMTQAHKDAVTGKLAATNGFKGVGSMILYAGQVLHYHPGDFVVTVVPPPPPPPPPATNLKDAPVAHGREITLAHVGPRVAQTVVYDTPQVITTSGVYSGIRYNKGVAIRADNVELKDCYIGTDVISSPSNVKVMASNVKIHHCEINNNSLVYFAIQQDYSATATSVNQFYRNHIHHCGQALSAAGSYWDFYENYVTDIVAPIPVPYPGDQPWHSDGVISWGEHLKVRKNKILISLQQTGAINIGTFAGMPAHDVTDVLVDSNYLAGAGFIFYVEERGTQKVRGFVITNNDIGTDFYTTGGYYGIWYPNARPAEKPTTSGNFLVDKTGKQLSACNYPF